MAWLTGWTYRKSQPLTAGGSVAGTISVTNGSNAIVGVGTFFTQWGVGDQIQLPNSNWYTIASITDNTHLTISIVYPGANASDQPYDMHLLNYQKKLLVGESAGATGEDVDCNSHVQTDFDDLRLTAADGTTLLPYWIESISGTTPNQLATVWIKFDSIGTGPTTFYMYYGKSDAPAASSGPDTFILFDHFDDATLAAIWSVISSQAYSEAGTELVVTGANDNADCIQSTSDVGTDRRVHFRGKFSNTSAANFFGVSGFPPVSTKGLYALYSNSPGIFYSGNCAVTTFDSANTSDITNYHIWGFLITAGKCVCQKDGTTVLTATTNYCDTAKPVTFRQQANGTTQTIDWVFVANYRDTEPAWGSWGSEELAETIVNVGLLSGAGTIYTESFAVDQNVLQNILSSTGAIFSPSFLLDQILNQNLHSGAGNVLQPSLSTNQILSQNLLEAITSIFSPLFLGESILSVNVILGNAIISGVGVGESYSVDVSLLIAISSILESSLYTDQILTQNIISARAMLHYLFWKTLEEFRYKTLRSEVPSPGPEGDFRYGRVSLTVPDVNEEGDFRYKRVS